MITTIILDLVTFVIKFVSELWPVVETLPVINGFDIDGTLVLGLAQVNQFFETFWPLAIMFGGFLFLMGYYIIKMTVKFVFGHRTPGN